MRIDQIQKQSLCIIYIYIYGTILIKRKNEVDHIIPLLTVITISYISDNFISHPGAWKYFNSIKRETRREFLLRTQTQLKMVFVYTFTKIIVTSYFYD